MPRVVPLLGVRRAYENERCPMLCAHPLHPFEINPRPEGKKGTGGGLGHVVPTCIGHNIGLWVKA